MKKHFFEFQIDRLTFFKQCLFTVWTYDGISIKMPDKVTDIEEAYEEDYNYEDEYDEEVEEGEGEEEEEEKKKEKESNQRYDFIARPS